MVHLRGGGCPKCGGADAVNKNRLSYNEFVAKINNKDNTTYSLITKEQWDNNYTNSKTKIPLLCKKHGYYRQTIGSHISGKHGCPKCSSSKGEIRISKWLDDNKINYIHQYRVKIKDVYYWFDFFYS